MASKVSPNYERKITILALFVLSLAVFVPPGTASAASSWGNGLSNSPTTNSIGAGYFMHATAGTVNETYTQFTVPTVKCTSGENAKAVYITGIDQPPETREGAGVSFGCNSGTPTYSGFYVIASIFTYYATVHPGDHMSATVSLSPSSKVRIVLKDLTKGHSWSTTASGVDPGATRTDYSWNVVLFPGPMLPNFGKLVTSNDWAVLNNRQHAIGYWSVNSAVTTEAVTMETAPGHKLAYPSFITDEAISFNIIWVSSA